MSDHVNVIVESVEYTIADPAVVYASLSPEIKAPALAMLATELAPAYPKISEMYADSPTEWAVPHHFHWGMVIRNLLRDKGFGEEYFGVDNLDDIYVSLVEEALKLR